MAAGGGQQGGGDLDGGEVGRRHRGAEGMGEGRGAGVQVVVIGPALVLVGVAACEREARVRVRRCDRMWSGVIEGGSNKVLFVWRAEKP